MAAAPSAEEQELLLDQLAALNADQIRDFMRARKIRPWTEPKLRILERVRQALSKQEVSWDALIGYLDQVEPYGRQHVVLYRGDSNLRQWGEREHTKPQLEKVGLGRVFQQRLAIAAPAQMTLSSVSLEEGKRLRIYAVTRRSHHVRRAELDAEVNASTLPGRNTLAYIYEVVNIRTWVRLDLDCTNGRASLHVAQLERKADYEAIVEQFLDLISTWFPTGSLAPLNLAKAVSRLHENAAGPAQDREVRLQAVQYDSKGGLHSSLSSSKAAQGIFGESDELDEAAEALRQSGPGAGGNFYFMATKDSGSSNPIQDEVHVTIVVKDNRINFRRPTRPDDLAWIIRRIRHHAT